MYSPTLIILPIVGLMTIPFAGLLLIEPAVRSAVLILGRLAWHLTPPSLWLGAVLIVTAWLLALRQMWANGG